MSRKVYVTMVGKMADVRDFEDFHMPRPFGPSDVLHRRQEQATSKERSVPSAMLMVRRNYSPSRYCCESFKFRNSICLESPSLSS